MLDPYDLKTIFEKAKKLARALKLDGVPALTIVPQEADDRFQILLQWPNGKFFAGASSQEDDLDINLLLDVLDNEIETARKKGQPR